MPPRPAALTKVRARLNDIPIAPFFCSACSTWRLGAFASTVRRKPQSTPKSESRRRHASTLASSTAINPPIDIPPQFRDLYKAVEKLKVDASSYVNLSRLQLALRGLETAEPVIRVALLGLNDEGPARKLARVLLADPLAAQGSWEKTIETVGKGDGRGLLIRHGDEDSIVTPSPLLPTLPVPSRVLQKQNIEIYISTLNTNTLGPERARGDEAKLSMLVPAVGTPASATGRISMITYPVHRALVFVEGVENCVAYGRFTAGMTEEIGPPDMIKVALSLPAPETQPKQDQSSSFVVVDVQLAAQALAKFRESTANAIVFEQSWFRSGMPALSDWLVQGTEHSISGLNPTIRNLISSIITDTSNTIIAEDAQRLQELVARSIPEATRQALAASLQRWAEQAHTELRDQLDVAFASKHWRKLAWWKLFFRVDDVSMIATEVLERRWLVEAEKGIIFLAGRVTEAGLATKPSAAKPSSPNPDERNDNDLEPSFGIPTSWLDHTRGDPNADDGSVLLPPSQPWLTSIPLVRHRLMLTTIPHLQSLAQTLVLQTLSTVSLSSALAALIYVSSPIGMGTTVYEAGAIASLGTVWALRRLQSKWEAARWFWEGEVREEGRRALKSTEDVVGMVVSSGGRDRGEDGAMGAEDRRRAREAVEEVGEALSRLGK